MNNTCNIINQSNISYFSQLEKADQKTIIYISNYLNNYSITMDELYSVQNDLINMTLEAYKEQKTLSNIIGDDLKGFCNEILTNYKLNNITKKLLFFSDVIRNLIIHTFISLFILCIPLYLLVYIFSIVLFLSFTYIEMYYKPRISLKGKSLQFRNIFLSYGSLFIAFLLVKPIHDFNDIAIPVSFIPYLSAILIILFIITKIQIYKKR